VNPVGWKGKPRAGEARDDTLPQAGEMTCGNQRCEDCTSHPDKAPKRKKRALYFIMSARCIRCR